MAETFTAANVEDVAIAIEARSDYASPEDPYMVSVCGASASGKSTLSRQLAGHLQDGSLVTMDRYLSEGLWDTTRQFNHGSPDPNRPYIGGISPEIWDMPLMKRQLSDLRHGTSVAMPIFDERIKDRVGYETFVPTKHIVVEGGHSFSSPFVELMQYKVLVNSSMHDRLMRKLFRACVVYGIDEGDEILGRYLTKDEPVHRHYLQERIEQADALVDNPLLPAREFAQADRPEDNSALYIGRLIPQPQTGDADPAERLLVTESNQGLGLSYRYAERYIFSTPVSHETFDLMLQFYDRFDHE